MNTGEAEDIVLGAMAATFVLAVVNDVRRKQTPRPRIVIGALGAAVILSAGAQVAPQPAAALAVVILLGTMFGTGGGATIDALANAVTARPARPAAEQQVTSAHPDFYGSR